MDLVQFLLLVGVVVLAVQQRRDRAALDQVDSRLARVEQLTGRPVAAEAAAAPEPPPQARVSTPVVPTRYVEDRPPAPDTPQWHTREPLASDPQPRTRSLVERLIAEHALALVGGLFVLVAAALFVGFAIEQGWIGPWAKFLLALALSGLLVAAALRVARRLPAHERIGRAVGSLHGVLAATGAGVAFIAIVAAVRVQELFTPGAGALLEVLVAAGAVQLARAWRSQDLAALGIGVGLAAPMLVGAAPSAGTILLLAVTIVAAVVLAVLERWPRLLLAAALVPAPQLASWADTAEVDPVIGVSLAWWGILIAGCVAATIRDERGATRSVVSTVFVIALGAAGLVALADDGGATWTWWAFLSVLAALHVLLGLVLLSRVPERSSVLAAASIGAGAVLAAMALADATGGAARVAGWAAEAVVLTMLWRRAPSLITALFAAALGMLAIGHVLLVDAPPGLLYWPSRSISSPFLAVGSIVAAAAALRWLVRRSAADATADHAGALLRRSSDAIAGIGAWYALALLLVHVADEGAAGTAALLLLGAWAAVGSVLASWSLIAAAREELALAALVAVLLQLSALVAAESSVSAILICVGAVLACAGLVAARRRDAMSLAPMAMGAIQATLLVLFVLARVPPGNLRAWNAAPTLEALAVLLLLVGALALLALAARLWQHADATVLRTTMVAPAIAALYGVSIAVVAAFTSTIGQREQDAQVALTLTWVALGAASLFAGTSLRLREHAELRIGAYGLLGIAAFKLVAVDTAQLETPMRVLAFLATGLGLLGSAALEQRMRSDDPR